MWITLIIIGIIAGIVSGLVGIGGGVIIVPALVMILGFSQKTAQGTTLALLIPPIGIFGALVYYRQGYVDIRSALFIIFGFVIGSIIGAKYITQVSNNTVARIFAIFLIIVAIKMLFDSRK